MIVSLNRWEWNRALFFGLIVAHRRDRARDRAGAPPPRPPRVPRSTGRDPEIAQDPARTRPPSRDRFAWLRESTQQLNVFITFLVGGGVLISGIAWVVDRVASKRRRRRPARRRLGRRARARSATRAAGCSSTTSRCWRRRCRAPTTSRSASCCAAAAAREEADARSGSCSGLVGLAIGIVAVLGAARSHAVDAPAGRRRRGIELVVSASTKGGEQNQTLARDGGGAAADVPPRGHVRPRRSDRAAGRRTLPCRADARDGRDEPPAVPRLRRGLDRSTTCRST